MTDVRVIEPNKFNSRLASALKKEGYFEAPAWVGYVKSGPGKVRPIDDPEFWNKRAASILRQIYVNKIVGVGRLRTRYGQRKKRGVQPEKFYKAGGKIIRTILQQAETAGLLEKAKGTRAGRQLSMKGKELLEKVE